ncbi:MAG: hypothetical protein J0L58_01215 [Burkholderiales bacterium]|nr:hypothetical protein [Burkholderiales bacterium]
MAVNDGFDMCGLIGLPERSTRVENFVWVYLAQMSPTADFLDSTTLPDRHCWGYLNAQQLVLSQIRYAVQTNWIPDGDLSWLTDDVRQCGWVQLYIARAMQAAKAIAPPERIVYVLMEERIPVHLDGADRSVALVDYWSSCIPGDLNQRRLAVNQLRADWLRQVKADQRLAWLDSEDAEDRRAWFLERLKASLPLIQSQLAVPKNHGALLNLLSYLQIHPAELELLNIKAKRDFLQQVRRATNANKRQCNFVLDERTVVKLKGLARKYGVPQTAVIEMLIQEEADKHSLIPNRLLSRSVQPLAPGV